MKTKLGIWTKTKLSLGLVGYAAYCIARKAYILWQSSPPPSITTRIIRYAAGGLILTRFLFPTQECNLLEKKINQVEYQKPTAIVETINKDYSDNRLEQILKN